MKQQGVDTDLVARGNAVSAFYSLIVAAQVCGFADFEMLVIVCRVPYGVGSVQAGTGLVQRRSSHH